jgi:hypothetical protein
MARTIRFSAVVCSIALSIWPGLGTAQDIDAKSFRCIREMTPVRQFYVDNLRGDLEATLAVANSNTGAALHYRHVPSEENNKVFGQEQSFVAGTPTNIQFMVKDSRKYAATGGWGFAPFQDGKPSGDEAFMKTCFPCDNQIKARDLVFTR